MNPLPLNRFLVYYRAEAQTGLYPHDPFSLLTKPRVFVCAHLEDPSMRFSAPVTDTDSHNKAIDFVLHNCAFADAIYSIHALSLLGRLVRWRSKHWPHPMPIAFSVPHLRDVVDAVNAPAVLSMIARHDFKLNDYVQLLGIAVDNSRGDPETDTLISLIKTYGS